ncbi:Uncharacterised protein [Bacillus freudenreichii]|nr:Uncharacterised protein [Bacillus freudenreichii]
MEDVSGQLCCVASPVLADSVATSVVVKACEGMKSLHIYMKKIGSWDIWTYIERSPLQTNGYRA